MDAERMRELGRRSGRARRKLNLERVEAELPPMDTPEHVKRRLEVATNWGAAGLLPGTVLNGIVQGCRVWFQLHDLEQERERVKALERQVSALERELDQARRAGLKAV